MPVVLVTVRTRSGDGSRGEAGIRVGMSLGDFGRNLPGTQCVPTVTLQGPSTLEGFSPADEGRLVEFPK